MRIASKVQMNQMDAQAIKQYQIPSLLLMEQAAYQVFLEIKERTEEKVVILCGMGNNAGDGLALARQLVIWTEKEVVVVMVDEAENLSQDAKVYHTMCQGVGVS
ncbi:MAG: NAD(P)H-hydrate epimerase, partial [Cellulosilyticaceae bacterium]